MNAAPQLQKANLSSIGGKRPAVSIDVHFNPASLVYTVENKSPQSSSGPKKRQFVAQFSGKLTMDLQFDTTNTGDDVRSMTAKVAKFMEPSANATHAADEANSQNPKVPAHAPPVLLFKWGSYQFKGIMESFKETIDLFSADGVALRSLVSIGLARQDAVFDGTKQQSPMAASGTVLPPNITSQQAANQGGDPSASRGVGAANGQESLRFSDGSPLVVNAAPQLNPPAAFATGSASASAGVGASAGASAGFSASAGAGSSAGAGFSAGASASAGFSAGAGAGVSASAGSSAGAGFGAGASAGFSAGGSFSAGAGAGFTTSGGALFGSKASAGVSASAGAFAGLQTGRATVSTTAQLDPTRMFPPPATVDVSTSAGASFSLGGAATSSASAGLSADVGASVRFSDRLSFDSD